MANLDPLKSFKSGFKGTAEHLKGKESLSDYQKNHKEESIDVDEEVLRRKILSL